MDSHTAAAHPAAAQPASPGNTFECLMAIGAIDQLECSAGNAFEQLNAFARKQKDWLFGHFSYALTRETEPVAPRSPAGNFADATPGPALLNATPTDFADSPSSDLPPASSVNDSIGFPDLFFFVPETVIELHHHRIRIGSIADPKAIWEQIQATMPARPEPLPALVFTPRFSRGDYLTTIQKLQQHILRGDCYEINFCQEFFCHPSESLPPLTIWNALSKASPNPFATFYRLDDRYLFCASPERYMAKKGDRLYSQPIKGTSPRYPHDPIADQASGTGLYHSAKNRSENVMVVDLVRNDLSKICNPGTVEVSELYGIYPFPQVYQMISTVTGQLPAGTPWPAAIEATFPMGSMTGAPKKKVVSLIDRYEHNPRGIFSGAVGYVTPEGDFDFNVVIRSLMYNRNNSYLSYQVGSGITFYSSPEEEYEECMLKAAGIRRALGLPLN